MKSSSLKLLRLVCAYLVEYARQGVAHWLTAALSALAFVMMVTAFVVFCLIFVSIGLAKLLAMIVSPHAAYLMVGAFYLFALLMLCLLRRLIIVKPIARCVAHFFKIK
jgi:succinate dehydrogenase hydrophobic anchor subunit